MKFSKAAPFSVYFIIALSVPLIAFSKNNAPENFLAHTGSDFLFENARVLDSTGEKIIENTQIWISKGKIRAIGASLATPNNIVSIDLYGHTIIPGLIHMHDHLEYMSAPFRGYDFLIIDPHPFSMPKLYLAAGVTTIRTAGTDSISLEVSLKRMINDGLAVGPDIFLTSPYLDSARGFLVPYARSYEAGRNFVKSKIGYGISTVKVYAGISPEALRGAIDEANENGIHVAGHLGYGTSCTEAAKLGIHTIEHSLRSCTKDFPSLLDKNKPFKLNDNLEAVDKLIDTLIENDVVMISTQSGGRFMNYSEQAKSVYAPFMREAFDAIDLEKDVRSESGNPMYILESKEEQIKFDQRFVARGGKLLLGADAMYLPIIPGYANQDIMVEMAQYFTPLRVIQMATADAADFLGIGDSRGRIEASYEADLLIVKGKPDVDMADIRNVALVVKSGRIYAPTLLRNAAEGRIGYD